MQPCLKNATMRNADRATIEGGVSDEELMARAGEAVFHEVENAYARLNAKSILVVCGTGNNGGDGYVVARLLKAKNLPVKVYAAEGNLSIGCRREKSKFDGEYASTIEGDIIVDCLFGTGLNRAVDGELAGVINAINNAKAYVISVDIPSGLNGDNGLVLGVAVRANLTVAIAYPKLGLYLNDGMDFSGEVAVRDIGIACNNPDAYIAEYADIKNCYPHRRRNTHKGSFGSACLVAGSERYLGAPVLAVSSALRSGCGYVLIALPDSLKCAVASKYPQCICLDDADYCADAVAVGMGMGCNERTYKTVRELLNVFRGKLIIDADGLNSLAKYGKDVLKQTKAQVVITPHVGEMARLAGIDKAEVISDPVGVAKAFAKEYGVCVHLKSAVCVTTDGQRCVITTRGTSALAKAGSGDMLSGLACGNCARGLPVFDAVVSAQYVLGLSAEECSQKYSDYATTAKEIEEHISFAVKRLTD